VLKMMKILVPRKIATTPGMKWLTGIFVGFFVLTAIARFWIHPSGSHIHRQSDTIGMSIAFSEQFRQRGFAALDFLLYPRILQRGLWDGINASEFPLLNVLGGFGFLLSSDPWVGVFLTSLLILIFNLWVAYRCLPQFLRAWKVEVSGSLGLLLWFSGATLAGQTHIMMPEGIAFPLVMLGVVEILVSQESLLRWGLGILYCSLGMAVKPTVSLVLGGLVMLVLLDEVSRSYGKRICTACLLSLVFPTWWYGMHAKSILGFAQGPQIFARAVFDPIQRLREVGIYGIFSLLKRELCQGQFPMFVGCSFLLMGLVLGEWILVILDLLSLLAAISLDGEHAFQHAYYFLGACVFSLILMARVLGATEKYLKNFVILCLVGGVLFQIRGNLWSLSRDSKYWKIDHWEMGARARKLIEVSYHPITDDLDYPKKLLFLGRTGTIAHQSAYEVCQQEQYARYPLAIMTSDPPPRDASCKGRLHEFRTIETSFEKWYVTLVK